MCLTLITYRQWTCGWHQSTGEKHSVDCRRTKCRLSNEHLAEAHDCAIICGGIKPEEHHLVMEGSGRVCEACVKAGRGEGQHPRIQNGTDKEVEYKYVGRGQIY